MYGSQSDYFYKEEKELKILQKKMKLLLYLKGYTTPEQKVYAKAFSFFILNPHKFDGATIVKDLHDLPGLDTDPMLHDYHYVVYNTGSSFYYKWKADWLFAKGNERKGKGIYSAYSRFVGLTLTGIFFVPYTYLTRGGMTQQQKDAFTTDFNTLRRF